MRFVLAPFIGLLLLSFVAGCGYKPSAKFSREVTGEKISTSVTISQTDPENTVLIKDAVDTAIIEIFHASLTSKERSDTHLEISMSAPSYTPIQYNEQGFVVGYRATISLNIRRTTAQKTKRYSVVGTYDFAIEPNAIITDQERFKAIENSAKKAIMSFLARVSAEGRSQQQKE